MIFSSLTFLLFFLPATLILYFLIPMKGKNLILLLMSLLFYAWGEPVYVVLMIYSILVNYLMGRLMDSCPGWKKEILVFSVIINLFVLGFFKYYGFLTETLNDVFGLTLKARELALPVGISFYTFQALSYVIDLYRGKFPAQKSLVKFACYITMFPQLIAGPIVRYEDIEEQLTSRKMNLARFGRGAFRFVFGLSKKVLLANMIGGLFDSLYALPELSALSSWLCTLAYTFQIYFDFSGYSDMALGLGDMLGFKFIENFRYPYLAGSVTDFWRRWHISLGTWFREYVYIPLGGNRVSALKHIRNILVVWMLTGLWHGASWNFVLWGVYYGILLLLEKYLIGKKKLPPVIGQIYTLFFVMIGWVIFYCEDLSRILLTLKAMFGGSELFDTAGLYYLGSYGILLILEAFFCLPLFGKFLGQLKKSMPGKILLCLLSGALLVLCVICLATENYNPFLYFRF